MKTHFFLLMILVLSGCSSLQKDKDAFGDQEYSIADIRPYFRTKTIFYFDEDSALQDVTELPFVPLRVGGEFGYIIPLKAGIPPWKLKEILTITCSEKVEKSKQPPVNPRILEWNLSEGNLKIQSFNEFEATDCPGTYNFKLYIQDILAEEINVFVK